MPKAKPASDNPGANDRFIIVVESEWGLPAYLMVDFLGFPARR
jgi:hypothetical protein